MDAMNAGKQSDVTLKLMREAYEIVDATPDKTQQNQMASMMLGVGVGYKMATLMQKPATECANNG